MQPAKRAGSAPPRRHARADSVSQRASGTCPGASRANQAGAASPGPLPAHRSAAASATTTCGARSCLTALAALVAQQKQAACLRCRNDMELRGRALLGD
jgi:hypothetical protein